MNSGFGNNTRTLSGTNELNVSILNLDNNRNAITIKGQSGTKGQVLQKSSTNKLQWGFVDDIEIPDGSIEGDKLAPNINISTTGNISATDITATNYFNQTNANATNTFQGELVVKKLYTTKESIEAIRVQNGGIIHIMENDGGSPDPALMISLSGVNGNIFCNQIRSSQIAFPKSGTTEVVLNEDGLVLTANSPIQGGSTSATLKNIIVNGGMASANQSIVCLGGITTGTDSAGNVGSLQMNTGGITLTLGDLTLSNATSTATFKGSTDVYGNSVMRGGADFLGDNAIDFIDSGSNLNMRISPDTGNITNPVGKLTMSKAGSTPAPTDSSSYTDWAIDVSNTNGHMRVAGNIICDGKIFGDVEGAITEEEVDCQRLTLRTATPPLSGITGMIMGAGSVITNDTSGNLELTIDADTSGILANNLSIIGTTTLGGNTTIGSTGNTTTTIGGTSSQDTLNVETTNINLGSSTGSLANIRTTIRGGTSLFNGDKVQIGTVPQGSNPPAGTSLEGEAGQQTNNLYRNNVRYFHLEGQNISHTLAGTFLYYRILRSSQGKQIPVAFKTSFSNTDTVYTQPTDFNFVDINAETSVAKIELDIFYRHYKGAPDLYCRFDSTSGGASAYPSQTGGPTLLVNAASANTGTEIRVTHSFYITGLIYGNDYSFYPKFANTTSAKAKGSLMYGGEFGDMSMNISFVEPYNGLVRDPYTSPSDLETAQTQEVISHIGNHSPYEFINVYDPSSNDLDSLTTSYSSLLFTNVAQTFTAERSTMFIEILSFVYSSSSNKTSYIRLADNGGNEWSSGTNKGGSGTGTRSTERIISVADETDRQPFTINYKLVGLTIGTSYTIQPQMKTSSQYNYVVAGGSYPATIMRAYYPPYVVEDVNGDNEPASGDDY